MHPVRLLPTLGLLAGLSCCSPAPAAALLAADAATVVVFGRGVVDIGISAVTGRDCSIVRLDRGQPYCAPRYAPVREAYCTRTLGAVDCWASPALLPAPRQGVGDTPGPTAAQTTYRAAPWPKALAMPP